MPLLLILAVIVLLGLKGGEVFMSIKEAIATHWAIANKVAQAVGCPAFALWAAGQAGVESLWSTSGVAVNGALNNPFGMKGGSWITGTDKNGKPILKAGRQVAGPYMEKATGKAYYYRIFPSLEAAYLDLWDLYSNRGPKAYTQAMPLLRAGNYAAFGKAVLPTYDPTNAAYYSIWLQRVNTLKNTLGIK
jgi:hypothetical protein